MLRLLIAAFFLVLLSGCTTKPGVRVDAGATQHHSSGRILFSQPF